ncbi:unnamed protein product [Onchocerca flexuosa]|uniref:Uncharacterized protein n=1 Tax=Onchocerca flexuosa TaxID=387005 RepID=A0A183HH07_9BILA|nr:unnamed protein product [Onchocerca flexuosa]
MGVFVVSKGYVNSSHDVIFFGVRLDSLTVYRAFFLKATCSERRKSPINAMSIKNNALPNSQGDHYGCADEIIPESLQGESTAELMADLSLREKEKNLSATYLNERQSILEVTMKLQEYVYIENFIPSLTQNGIKFWSYYI